jgi:hypothetical protein
MLSNPYNPSGAQWSENHLVQGRVSQEDFAFLKGKFPFNNGLIDKIVAISFKKIIDELRKIDSTLRLDTALYVDDASYAVLDDIISRLQVVERSAIGSVSGDERRNPTQHVTGGVSSVHSTVQLDASVSTDKKGISSSRKRRSKGTKKKEIQR